MRPDFKKIWIVTATEFSSSIRTKAFFLGLMFLPLLVGGSIGLQLFLVNRVDARTRSFAVIDRTGTLYPVIERATQTYNDQTVDPAGKTVRPRFAPSLVPSSASDGPAALLELSERIRRGELDAFVVIPAEAVQTSTPGAAPSAAVEFHSDSPNDDAVRNWLIPTINNEIHERRFRSAGFDPALADRLNQPVRLDNLGLFERDLSNPNGPLAVKPAVMINPIRTAVIPFVLMYVMFLIIMTTTPQLLNSVMEEKLSKISEVLLGSVTPFELMMGKLIGQTGIALLLGALYLAGGYVVASRYDYSDVISSQLLVALGFFVALAVLLYGSLYMAVGSACNELKDAQSLMMPVMMLSMIPVMASPAIIKDPASPLSVGLSLFPPASPYLMLMRLAMRPTPPAWQVGLAVVGTTLTAVLCVWASGKIFRTGLLMQGKTPSFRELARWVMAK
jgi:ABC-2 type transport system permease protein